MQTTVIIIDYEPTNAVCPADNSSVRVWSNSMDSQRWGGGGLSQRKAGHKFTESVRETKPLAMWLLAPKRSCW